MVGCSNTYWRRCCRPQEGQRWCQWQRCVCTLREPSWRLLKRLVQILGGGFARSFSLVGKNCTVHRRGAIYIPRPRFWWTFCTAGKRISASTTSCTENRVSTHVGVSERIRRLKKVLSSTSQGSRPAKRVAESTAAKAAKSAKGPKQQKRSAKRCKGGRAETLRRHRGACQVAGKL